MHISELARQAGVTVKAVRYYERLGLVTPGRESNGYRRYSSEHVRIVDEIHRLSGLGIPPSQAAPFIDCLASGHARADECPASLAAYQDSIEEIDRQLALLSARRAVLTERLSTGAGESAPGKHDDFHLPDDLPEPVDDGAADHLPGVGMPEVTLSATNGTRVDLARLGGERTVLYLYPLTGRPGVDLPTGWDAIPGARGCTPESCGFRDHFDLLAEAGIERVFGLSSQSTDYQREVVERLRLPFAMLSDEHFGLADALRLPTFSAPGHERLYSRLTLIIRAGRIEHVFYPVFPPNTHAHDVLAWVNAHP